MNERIFNKYRRLNYSIESRFSMFDQKLATFSHSSRESKAHDTGIVVNVVYVEKFFHVPTYIFFSTRLKNVFKLTISSTLVLGYFY